MKQTIFILIAFLLLVHKSNSQDYWPFQLGQTSTYRNGDFEAKDGSSYFFTLSFDTILQHKGHQVGYFNLSRSISENCQLHLIKKTSDFTSDTRYMDSMLIKDDFFILYSGLDSFKVPQKPRTGFKWTHNNLEFTIASKVLYSKNSIDDSAYVIKTSGFNRELLLSKQHGLLTIANPLNEFFDPSFHKPLCILYGRTTRSDTLGIVRPSAKRMFNLRVGDVLIIRDSLIKYLDNETFIEYYKDSVIEAEYHKTHARYRFVRTIFNQLGQKNDTSSRAQTIMFSQFDTIFSLNRLQFHQTENQYSLTEGAEFEYSDSLKQYKCSFSLGGFRKEKDTCKFSMMTDAGVGLTYNSLYGYPESAKYSMNSTRLVTVQGAILNGKEVGKTKIPISVTSPSQNQVISLYPNAGSGVFNLENSTSDLVNYQVYSLHGKLVYIGAIEPFVRELDLSELKTGSYLIKYQNRGFSNTERITIVK